MNTYYYKCPYCGAYLDPGEKCDCDRGALRDDNKLKNERIEYDRQLFFKRRGGCYSK